MIGYFVYKKYYYNKNLNPTLHSKSNNQVLQLYFFHTDWCPACVKTLPIYSKFVSKYNNTIINGYTIVCINAQKGTNCSDENNSNVTELMTKFSIKHFPTIKFVSNGKIIDFDSKITEENLIQCIQLL
jgi:thiol-disulfide isomerase/thioredoxin